MGNGKSITWTTILPASIAINIYLRYKKDPILYFMLRDDDNDLFNKTGVYINTKFYYQISNNSNRISKILPLELDSA